MANICTGYELESIIKIEPEELQHSFENQASISLQDVVPIKESNNHADLPEPEFSDSDSDVELLESIIKVEPEEVQNIPTGSSVSREERETARQDYDNHPLQGGQVEESKMICDLCSRMFRNKHEMEHHMKMIHLRPIFDCDICDFKSPHFLILETHKKIHVVQNECRILNEKLAALERSIKVSEKNLFCEKCKRFFCSKKILSRHKERIHGPRNCHCGLVFTNRRQLKKHKLSHNAVQVQQREVVGCGQPSASSSLATPYHTISSDPPAPEEAGRRSLPSLATQEPMEPNPLTEDCSASGGSTEPLESVIKVEPKKLQVRSNHKVSSQSTVQRLCPLCNEMVGWFQFKRHIKQNHKEKRRKQKCIYDEYKCTCGALFANQSSFHAHVVMLKVKKVSCEVCDENFPRKTFLRQHWRKQHVATHGPMVDERHDLVCPQLKCDQCDYSSPVYNALRIHILVEHAI